MSSIKVSNLNKIFSNGKVGLNNLSFYISPNEFIALVGPSGSGKTTLLKLLCGLDTPTSGEILIDGGINVKKHNTSIVMQQSALLPQTAYKNISLSLKLIKKEHLPEGKLTKEQKHSRILEAAQALGIAHLLDQNCAFLSGGERQRVSLARALVRSPKLILLDEPFASLDEQLKIKLREQIIALKSSLKATFIYVTHDINEAMAMADRIMILNEGKLVQLANREEVYHKPINIFAAQIAGKINFYNMNINNGVIELFSNKIKVKQADGEYILGIRPEDISIGKGTKAIIESVYESGINTSIKVNTEGKLIELIIPSEGFNKYKKGQSISIMPNNERIMLFDPKTKRILN